MSKAKGVWLQPTELGEVAEATIIKEGLRCQATAPISKASVKAYQSAGEQHRKRSVLTVTFGIFCCLLTGLIVLRVFGAASILPVLVESVDASQALPVMAKSDSLRPELSENLKIRQWVFSYPGSFDFKAENRNYLPSLAQYLPPPAIDAGQEPDFLLDSSIAADALAKAVTKTEEEHVLEGSQPEEATLIPVPADEVIAPVTAPTRALELQPVIASRSGDSADIGELTLGEETFKYTRRLSMESTAYTWTGDKTATGTWPTVGTIAVDPQVIPLGSLVYVDGYGLAIAEDTGRLIKGNIIDVYLDTTAECIKWGRKRGVSVYILEDQG